MPLMSRFWQGDPNQIYMSQHPQGATYTFGWHQGPAVAQVM